MGKYEIMKREVEVILFYGPQLIVSLENKAHSVTLLSSSSLVLCKFKVYRLGIRSSCPEVFCKKAGLRNFAKFTEKHQCQRLSFNKEKRVSAPGLQLY